MDHERRELLLRHWNAFLQSRSFCRCREFLSPWPRGRFFRTPLVSEPGAFTHPADTNCLAWTTNSGLEISRQGCDSKIARSGTTLSQAITAKEENEDRHFFAFAHVLRADGRRISEMKPERFQIAVLRFTRTRWRNPRYQSRRLHICMSANSTKQSNLSRRLKSEDGRRRILLPWGTAYIARKEARKGCEFAFALLATVFEIDRTNQNR